MLFKIIIIIVQNPLFVVWGIQNIYFSARKIGQKLLELAIPIRNPKSTIRSIFVPIFVPESAIRNLNCGLLLAKKINIFFPRLPQ